MVDITFEPPWTRLPFVHEDTGRLPDETMAAIAESPELAAHIIGALAGQAGDLLALAQQASDAAIAARGDALAAAQGAAGDRAAAGTSAFNAGASAAASQSSEDDARAERVAAVAARAAAEAARDLALAGQFAGSSLAAAVDFNALRTPGIFTITGTAAATALNMPVIRGGVLRVTSLGGGTAFVQQEFAQHGTSVGQRQGTYRRYSANGTTWDPWTFIPPQRVDQTAGRAIYTWDDVNGREQLIYGDTGTRSIVAAVSGPGTVGGTFRIRRLGSLVEIAAETLNVSATGDYVFDVPFGFRSGIAVGGKIFSHGGATSEMRITLNWNGLANRLQGMAPAVGYSGRIFYTTTDAWPTTLPGDAVGGIPNV